MQSQRLTSRNGEAAHEQSIYLVFCKRLDLFLSNCWVSPSDGPSSLGCRILIPYVSVQSSTQPALVGSPKETLLRTSRHDVRIDRAGAILFGQPVRKL